MKEKFIEFLTKKFSRSELVGKAYSTDEEMIKHFMSGEVTIPVTLVTEFLDSNRLPSRYQVGDKVSVRFKPMFVVDTAEIIKIHFTDRKVTYDLEVQLDDDDVTRLYNIDSFMLSDL